MEAVVENAAGIAPPATNITSAPNATFYPEDYCLVQHLIYSDAATAIFGLLYAAIFVCGIAGNLLVCIAVLKAKHLHTVTNFFIANLAASGRNQSRARERANIADQIICCSAPRTAAITTRALAFVRAPITAHKFYTYSKVCRKKCLPSPQPMPHATQLGMPRRDRLGRNLSATFCRTDFLVPYVSIPVGNGTTARLNFFSNFRVAPRFRPRRVASCQPYSVSTKGLVSRDFFSWFALVRTPYYLTGLAAFAS